MDSNPAPGSTLGSALWFLSEVAFKWMPGVAMSVAGVGVPSPGEVSPLAAPMTAPVSAPQIVQYLQTASAPGAYEKLYQSWSTFVAFSLLITLCLTGLSVYCAIRVFQIRQMERRKFAAAQRTGA